jgi:hypothetical protein
MKKLLVVFAVLAMTVPALALKTRADEIETLFDSKEFKSGGYGAPELKYTQINGEPGLMVGGRGGWIVNSTFSIGLAGYGVTTSHTIKNYFAPDSAAYLRVGYGGLFLNYTNSSDKLLHFTINALIGAGGATYTNSWNNMFDQDHDWNMHNYETSAFFVFEPGAGVEVNLTKWFRIEMGASYRIISGVELSRTANKDLGGFSGNLAFKFGSF